MNKITGKMEFANISATLCGRMVSLDADTRRQASIEAQELLDTMPKFLLNSPHCAGEINALKTFIANC